MPSTIKVCDEERCVEVTHHGVLTMEELKQVRADAGALLTEKGFSRLLVNGQAASVERLSTVDVFQFNTSHGSALPPLRLAIVIAKDHLEQSQFSENVARNRGFDMRVFLEDAEARRWLAEVD